MWVLYSTLGCHLCEQALDVINQVIDKKSTVEIIDISEDAELMENYGIRIPVIKNNRTQNELGWPFSESELTLWMQSQFE